MSDRLRQLAERQAQLQERCAAQRAEIAGEIAAIEARFARVDRIAVAARGMLLHPVGIVGVVVTLLTIGRLRGTRLAGRLFLLGTAVRRMLQTLRRFRERAPAAAPPVH